MMTLSLFLIFVLSSMTMIMNSPVLLLFNILMMALTISWLTGAMFSSWYSFLVFLIYIGGMMVMFSYFVALSPNQYLKINNYINSFITSILFFPAQFNNNMKPYKFDSLYLYSPVYNWYQFYMLMFMIILLLMMMLIVVKMINTSKGPLRPFMYV
uniref:NADH dehydrogenase subunit 6 n=1 Tax=Erpobdella japonica TaxID=184739 RepID=A0A343KJQ6_9ANNE|nr:NADH dehydrogenase subunit 6 [Erpobdella japonica]ATG87480.1 NADH dehydrogenase subunit 6 [Erpobdella japonica]